MSHMVIYRGADGKPGYHQTDDIHDAVGFVEQMRNQDGVEHARIFRLEEVVFEYKPYYRVELADSSGRVIDAAADGASAGLPAGDEGANGGEAAVDVSESEGETVDIADDADASENGEVRATAGNKKGLFGR